MESNLYKYPQVSPILLRIANTILSNYSMTTTPNLVGGRMGVCLFLYEYAKFTGIKEYEDIADEMMDLILKILNKGESEDNVSSLSGIGIGVIYLITHQFLEDTDEYDSLEELDKLLLETIESAKTPSEMVMQSALYFIYRYLYYRIGLDRKYCHKLAGQLVMLFRNNERTDVEDGDVWAYILHYAKLIYKITQKSKSIQCKCNTILLERERDNCQNQISAESMWFNFLFGRKTLRNTLDEETLFELCQSCFYDADRIIGILCGYGLVEMNRND